MGVVFDIQRLSVHDGPGIRTTVFLKGCPLRCKWCHNPESYYSGIQLQFIEDKCIQCEKCASICKEGVHFFYNGKHMVDFEKCVKCGRCVEECPSSALDFFGKELTSQEVLDEVSKDEVFFGEDGGVTFSGGEATLQIDFLTELLKGAKEKGYHTCVDTCGYATWDKFLRIIPYTDCFLYDIKSFSSEIHQKATGVGNELILDNLKKLSGMNCEIYIRMPLIKEYNAKVNEIKATAKMLSKLKVKGITLMPYHVLGRAKRTMLGMELGKVFTAPTAEEMERFKYIFVSNGVEII